MYNLKLVNLKLIIWKSFNGWSTTKDRSVGRGGFFFERSSSNQKLFVLVDDLLEARVDTDFPFRMSDGLEVRLKHRAAEGQRVQHRELTGSSPGGNN